MNQAGGVAAPIAGQILGDVLPYLEVKKSNGEEENLVSVPDVKGLTLKQAQETLEGFNIQVISDGEYTKESNVYKQIPEAGVEISDKGNVILYVQ